MKKIIMVAVMLLMVSWAFGEKINLINGETIEGKIEGKSFKFIYIYSEEESTYYGIDMKSISKIYDDLGNDISQEIATRENFNDGINFNNLISIGELKSNSNKTTIYDFSSLQKSKYKTKVNPGMLAISLSLIALAVDSYSEASDLSKAIEDYEEFDDIDTSELKKDRTRKNVVGTICVISSIISFTASFEKVEIKASPTSVSLGYRF